jgi:ArsR family transcriptional regulator, lead/cadmium/zinc/bismuth-responsive transcriptional repressor
MHARAFELLAQTFQALGDPSRVRLVYCLRDRERSVGELVDITGLSQPAVSHHLRLLRHLSLVKVRKSGRVSFYVLDDVHIGRLLDEGMDHILDYLPRVEVRGEDGLRTP